MILKHLFAYQKYANEKLVETGVAWVLDVHGIIHDSSALGSL